MKILYLTTARHPKDYASLLADRQIAPNPSNQSFHTKLIKLLTTSYAVKVVSTRPMAHGLFLRREKNDPFLYPGYMNLPLLRNYLIFLDALNETRTFMPHFIFVDALNVSLLEMALNIKKIYKVKIIGIVTDNPHNITDTKKGYGQKLLKLANELDGYIGLTENLIKLFNPRNKPSIIIPGFINPSSKIEKEYEEYAFFAGALYDKYGVNHLIEAFKDDSMPLKLTIAGHGPLGDYLKKNPHKNIEYIGQITPEVSYHLTQKAKILINPRPIDDQIDRFSVPSKVIDYISSGSVTISTLNKEIYDLVGDSICWISDNETQTIVNAVKNVSKDYAFWRVRSETARKTLLAALEPQKLIKKINELIESM